MFCTRCGTAVPDNVAFCTTCGTPMQTNQPAPPPVYQAPPTPPPPVYQAPPPAYQTPPPPPQNWQPPQQQVMAQPQAPQTWAPPVQQAVAPPLPYSGFWTRFWAYLIDSLILGAVSVVFLVVAFLAIGGGALVSGTQSAQDFFAALGVAAILLLVFAYFAMIAVMWLYFAKMESSEKQATVGKKAMGIYVTDLNGQRLTFGRASGRFFSKIITGMIPFAIGWIMVAFTAKKQALHDMIAGTLVWRRQ
ncbi:MAG: RDD family protein [Candidatus Acidiferrales bacterium]